MDSLFAYDPAHNTFARDTVERRGHRFIEECIDLVRGVPQERKWSLNHLSSRNLLLRPGNANEVVITVEDANPKAQGRLKAELAVTDKTMRRRSVIPATLGPEENPGAIRTIAWTRDPEDDADTLILVVSNCGLTSADDGAAYKLHVIAC